MNAHKKQVARLKRRRLAFENSPYSHEGPSKRRATGGYHEPGSMNAHKSHPKGRR